MRVAVIGLGVMGTPMALNLVSAGHDVVGMNRSPANLERLVARGGRRAASVAEAVAGADVVFTILPDGPDVEDVCLGPDGVYASAAPGTLHIECSTTHPSAARKLAEVGSAHGVRVLDAPVSGGEAGAIQASLSIMVGGSGADFEAALPILSAVGTTIVHVGPVGAGQTVKAANQLLVAGNIQLVAEALAFLDAAGVDIETAIRVLSGGLAQSAALERKGLPMFQRKFTPGFRISLHCKDMGIVLDAAAALGTSIPVGTKVAQLIEEARQQGYGDLDHSALFLLLAPEVGTKVLSTEAAAE